MASGGKEEEMKKGGGADGGSKTGFVFGGGSGDKQSFGAKQTPFVIENSSTQGSFFGNSVFQQGNLKLSNPSPSGGGFFAWGKPESAGKEQTKTMDLQSDPTAARSEVRSGAFNLFQQPLAESSNNSKTGFGLSSPLDGFKGANTSTVIANSQNKSTENKDLKNSSGFFGGTNSGGANTIFSFGEEKKEGEKKFPLFNQPSETLKQGQPSLFQSEKNSFVNVSTPVFSFGTAGNTLLQSGKGKTETVSPNLSTGKEAVSFAQAMNASLNKNSSPNESVSLSRRIINNEKLTLETKLKYIKDEIETSKVKSKDNCMKMDRLKSDIEKIEKEINKECLETEKFQQDLEILKIEEVKARPVYGPHHKEKIDYMQVPEYLERKIKEKHMKFEKTHMKFMKTEETIIKKYENKIGHYLSEADRYSRELRHKEDKAELHLKYLALQKMLAEPSSTNSYYSEEPEENYVDERPALIPQQTITESKWLSSWELFFAVLALFLSLLSRVLYKHFYP
jgi:hypothetical protein